MIFPASVPADALHVLADFAAHMHTSDPEELTHLLLAPCHIEVEESGKPAA